ncbi:hypothetical protein CYMTET_31844 [Cymbomonas tetramitiformis]|uniref:Uncharacterized protein n=1 Tax=Cymbomonas tetramitiformis TaxID=36881 RepID=A0AAE0KSJ4_9CHLO|nr:hypothetical protein CYMTET_31803 [Cymbomonas tetramitiformis]KAK3259184.1 hypothetical protein CYMTET_31844 [Cymbomonas tetramitiformis]
MSVCDTDTEEAVAKFRWYLYKAPPTGRRRSARFVFHSQSKNEPPGCAKGEALNDDDAYLYEDLAKVDDWRKKLYNFWIEPFEHNNRTYTSAAHAYNAQRFFFMADMRSDEKRSEALRYAEMFSNNNDYSKLTGFEMQKLAKSAGPRLTEYEAKRWDYVAEEKLAAVVRSKFEQCDIARAVLLLTKRSTLIHRMSETARLYHWWSFLENVREDLREKVRTANAVEMLGDR